MIFAGESSKTNLSPEEKQELRNQQWSYRTERWRYISYSDGSEELYDHDQDPREWTNLAESPEYSIIKAELYRKLRKQAELDQ